MAEGVHTWMNVVRSDEVKAAVALVASSDDKIEEFAQHLKPGDLRVLEADLTRTFDAFEADFPGCNSDENHDMLRRVLLCALHNVGCGYCQVRRCSEPPPSRAPGAARGGGARRAGACREGAVRCCTLSRPNARPSLTWRTQRASQPRSRPSLDAPTPGACPCPRSCVLTAPLRHAPAPIALALRALPATVCLRRGSIS